MLRTSHVELLRSTEGVAAVRSWIRVSRYAAELLQISGLELLTLRSLLPAQVLPRASHSRLSPFARAISARLVDNTGALEHTGQSPEPREQSLKQLLVLVWREHCQSC